MMKTFNQVMTRAMPGDEYLAERQRRFVSDAAHELRTPLTALGVSLEEALLYSQENDPLAAMQDALTATKRLEGIVSDLLFLAGLTIDASMLSEVIDLPDLVSAEIAHRSSAPVYTAPEQTTTVRGSRRHLRRLINNLLDNAERHAKSPIHVQLCSEGQHATLTVADDGPGIPQGDRKRVFEPFARVDSARDRKAGGVGLGLAIAHGIAKASGGTLEIDNGSIGALLILRLPLTSTLQASRR
ncbi:sensor histidine kinase [Spirillospora sp. CA-255316]